MGNPFCHVELAAGDIAAAKSFYRSVFDWKLEDLPMEGMPYTMIAVGKGTGGGMMQKHMAEQPTAWLPYVEVADVAKSLAKAKSAGATIVVDAMLIGEGMGSMGVFVDPQGAALGVWSPPAKAAAPKKKAAPKKAAPKKAAPKKKAAKAKAKPKKKGRR
jgi:predicted enzyme related to lactoylglutathione lyase